MIRLVRDMTQGRPTSLILRFCLPLMAGNLFQQFYNMVDSIIVGRFVGKAALSAVGSVGALNFMVIGSVIGLCTGFSIPISQCFGAGDHIKMRRFIANLLYLSCALGVAITLATYCGTDALLRILHTPAGILGDARTYISIIFLGIPAVILYNSVASLIRAVGDSRTPLFFLIFSSLLNIALDLLFVLRMHWGVMGVAVATDIAQGVSGLLGLVYLHRHFPLLHIRREDMQPSGECCGKLLYAGLPMALQFSITAVGSVMLQSNVNDLGADVIAAVAIAAKTQLFLVLPGETIGMTLATFCGQNLGAKRVDRIRTGVRQGLLLALVYAAAAILLNRFGSRYVLLLFVRGSETNVLSLAQQFLTVCSRYYAVLVILFSLRYALQGMGFSIPAMIAGVFELAARGVMGYVFVRMYAYPAVCIANPVAWMAADVFLIPMYLFVMHKFRTDESYLQERMRKAYA